MRTLPRRTRRRLVVRAHAKINLDLRVVGLRSDGFHELRTVFQSIELHDTLRFAVQPGAFTLTCHQPDVPLNRTNLVWRAATRLWQALGRDGEPHDMAVSIDKRIPVRAGLGGGSADAAASLMALANLWGAQEALEDLDEVAGSLGSDVPYFLWGGLALGLGRGDEVYPLADLPRHWVTLVLPGFGVSTAEAYGWYDAAHTAGRASGREAHRPTGLWPIRSTHLGNDLEGPVASRHPEIVAIKAALRAHRAVATGLSGSGSAVFGLFEVRRDAAVALTALAESGWRGLLTRTVSRQEYVSRLIVGRAAGPGPFPPRAASATRPGSQTTGKR